MVSSLGLYNGACVVSKTVYHDHEGPRRSPHRSRSSMMGRKAYEAKGCAVLLVEFFGC